MSSGIVSQGLHALAGQRVLVVEDEVAISMLLEDMLLEFGAEVVGPAARLPAALGFVETEPLDLAILDVNVGGQPIYPVAAALDQRGVRYVFSTGYGLQGIEEAFRNKVVLQKPFTQTDLEKTLLRAISS